MAVLGAGAVGTSMCFFAKLAGAEVAVAARRKVQLDNAVKAGADMTVNILDEPLAETLKEWSKSGITHILDGAGSAEMLISASAALAENGAVCSYAGNAGFAENFGRLQTPINWKLLVSPPKEATAHNHLLSLTRMKVIPFEAFYSDVLPLEDISAGFDRIFAKQAEKTVFTMHKTK